LRLAKQEIATAGKIATAQFINQFFYLFLGPAQLMHGTLSFIWALYDTVQKFFQLIHSTLVSGWHLLPGLTSPLLHGIAQVAGVAAGAFYFIRGICIIGRSVKSKAIVDDFQKRFKQAGEIEGSTKDKVNSLMQFMQKQEGFANNLEQVQVKGAVENLGTDYLKRRFSPEFLTKIEKDTVYTAHGKLHANGKLTAYDAHNLKEQVNYLKAVDKGIFTEQLKHKLGLVIGTAMVIAAVLTIVAGLVVSGPFAPLIIGLVACIVFACMERAFFVYDNSESFENWRDSKYQVSAWLQPLVDAANAEQFTGWLEDMQGLTDLNETAS
jgi:hypothetical protein